MTDFESIAKDYSGGGLDYLTISLKRNAQHISFAEYLNKHSEEIDRHVKACVADFADNIDELIAEAVKREVVANVHKEIALRTQVVVNEFVRQRFDELTPSIEAMVMEQFAQGGGWEEK